MAVQPDLRQVSSIFGGSPGMAELWVSRGAIWRDTLLAEALVFHSFCTVTDFSAVSRSFADRREILHGGSA